MTLAELKKREAYWRKSYDVLIEETDATEDDVTEAQSARFNELHEEANAILAAYAEIPGPKALRTAQAFAFLFRNVGEMGRAPEHVREICAAIIN